MKNLNNKTIGFFNSLTLSIFVTFFILYYGFESALSSEKKIYWIDGGNLKIQRSDMDGSKIEDLVGSTIHRPSGIAIDPVDNKIYWVDDGADKIQRANLDGSNVEDIIFDIPYATAIDIDPLEGKIYWTDTKVMRANVDGSNIENIVFSGNSDPAGITLDLAREKIYWTDIGNHKIRRANLDGSNGEDIVTTGLVTPYRIAIDHLHGKFYWTDLGSGKIQCAKLDGSEVKDIITELQYVRGIDIDASVGKMYWISSEDWSNHKINRANLDGSDFEVLIDNLSEPQDIVLSVAHGYIYWTDTVENKISRSVFDGSNKEDLIIGYYDPKWITIDAVNKKMYWSDHGSNSFYIRRAELDGSQVENLVSGDEYFYPVGIDIDHKRRKLYWASWNDSNGKIQNANLDGTLIKDVVTGLTGPWGIALDCRRLNIYWSLLNIGADGVDKIQRSNFDGTGVTDVIFSGLDQPYGIVTDSLNQKLYWVDAATEKLQRANFDGTDIKDVITGIKNSRALALDVSGNKIYWTEGWPSGQIKCANMDGTEIESVIQGLKHPSGIALYISNEAIKPVTSVELADTTALSDTDISIPVVISGTTKIGRAEIKISYNENILTVQSIQTTSLTSGFSIADTITTGKVVITLTCDTATAKSSGNLLNVVFHVNKDAVAGDTTALLLEAKLYDEYTKEITSATQNGFFTVGRKITKPLVRLIITPAADTLKVGESVQFTAQGFDSEGDILFISPAWQIQGGIGIFGNSDGIYIVFQGTTPGTGQIIASQDGISDTVDVLVGTKGDVSGDNIIDVRDAIISLRIAVGHLTLPPIPPGHLEPTVYENWAGDLNIDRKIDEADALLILYKSLGRFFKSFSACSDQPAIAVWTEVQRQGLTTVTLSIKNRTDIYAAGINLFYDYEHYEFLEIVNSVMESLMECDLNNKGSVKVSTINSEGLLDRNGNLFHLILKRKTAGVSVNAVTDGSLSLFNCSGKAVEIKERKEKEMEIPDQYVLCQNFPNPFNPMTEIRYYLPKPSHVRLSVHNLKGQLLRVLIDTYLEAGEKGIEWNGCQEDGYRVPSGVYIYQLDVMDAGFQSSRKMVLIK
ncbi:DUF5050 domain-containing protein [candidate division KSB1 bacterium]|nr:DUF5050 domain-containing protein [candidate division KSB1 bacterium]